MEGLLEPVEPLDTRRYQLAVRKLADTLSHGTDRSRFLGSGIEFVQSRPYIPGDPVRAIDWRVTSPVSKVPPVRQVADMDQAFAGLANCPPAA